MNKPIFTWKQRLEVILLSLVMVLGWWLVARFAKEESVARISLWADFVFGSGAMITSVVAIAISVSSLKREEMFRRQKIADEAQKFILDNDDEILYIPFCLIANAYDNHHKYVRKIYNAFNVLNVETQEEVLKQLHYTQGLVKGSSWVDSGVESVRDFIRENDLGKDYLYDGAKYFHDAIEKYASEACDSKSEYAH